MKNFFLSSLIEIISFTLLFSSNTLLFSQEIPDFSREILIYIEPNGIEFPANERGTLLIDNVNILDEKLQEIFMKFEIENISKVFPDFNDSDTTKVREDGITNFLPKFSRVFRVNIGAGLNIDLAIAELEKIPEVLFAEKNSDAVLNNDPTYSYQWHLNNTGQSGGNTDADIDAPEAWSIFTGSSSIKIGIFDTGVQLSHDEFSGKISGDDINTIGTDFYWSHATHVAGIAAAKANNNKGGRGVDWNAQIDSRRIFDGYGNYYGDVTTANKIISAVDAGVSILNHSWSSDTFSSTLRMAFVYAYLMNRVSVAATGNNYGNIIRYPAAFGPVIAVGSTTDEDVRSDFSNWGNWIDVTAPGGINPYGQQNQHDIWSTWRGNSYSYLAGTSMATPVVTGLASLLKGYNPTLFNDDIEQIIRLSADDKGDPGWDQYYGSGRVNVYNALRLIDCPNQLVRLGPYTGGTVVSTESFNASTVSVPGLPNGFYNIVRYEVVKDIQFPSFMFAPSVQGLTFSGPIAWGNSNATPQSQTGLPKFTGYCVVCCNSSQYNYGDLPFTEVVPGTITKAGCRLRTYVYSFRTTYYISGICAPWGDNLGYFPTSPSNVKFYATVLGIPKSIPCAVEKQNLSITQTSTDYVLEQNYPNPFNPNTEISYSIKDAGQVTLRIHDMLGREVATLVNEVEEPGFYKVKFDAGELSSGVYFYSLKSGNFYQIKKMIVVK